MRRTTLGLLALINVLAAAPLAEAQVAPAPGIPQAPSANPDADMLSAQMRVLADNPENLDALIAAGQAATRLGDLPGAEAFFRRAGQVAPSDPRLLAAKAALAVREEHPGEALGLFAQSASRGVALDDYLGDRGLAYDLVGDQPRAQQDYRAALKLAPNDETTRRLALSLAIAGKREAALAALDPLVRKSDRGAWRVRAFVLAMTGDPAGAEQIANAMLSPAMASGLQHFFYVLPTLTPVDKAFAVHFGELRATPDRVADARLAPVLPPLVVPAEAPPRVAVAAVPTPAAKGRRKRERVAPVVVAPPVQVAAAPLPPPPREEVVTVDTNVPPAREVALASPPQVSRPVPAPTPAPAYPTPAPQPAPKVTPPPVAVVSAPAVVSPPVVKPIETRTVTAATVTPAPPPASPPVDRGTPERPSEHVEVTGQSIVAPPVTTPPPAPATAVAPPPTVPVPAVPTPVATAKPVEQPAVTTSRPVRSDDALLANIVAGLSEKPAPRVKSKPAPAPDAEATKEPAPPRGKSAAADKEDCAPLKSAHGKKPATPARKAKASSACPVDKDAKPTKKKDDPAKKEPARIWVQVAGGANHRDLIKAWNAAKAKAPAAFKGRKGWTTPLRATNRVLTGPFKTRDDAQDFVNSVAKSGISAFVFESEAGQKIDPLDAK
ncbi:SPOR domain-containing protein [Sphingomonas sp. GlSt437]|uniref:tetratricopeptide repeat protein n=2 Tax=Pseudomonadota TaxID=1224 RepID=UPI003A856543